MGLVKNFRGYCKIVWCLKQIIVAPAFNRTPVLLPAATLLPELPVLYCWRCNGQIKAKRRVLIVFLAESAVSCADIIFCVGSFYSLLQAASGIGVCREQHECQLYAKIDPHIVR